MRIDLVTVVVEEYDPAIDFFVGVLGFELVEDSPSLTNDGRPKRWVVVRPPGVPEAGAPTAPTGLLLARADSEDQVGVLGRQVAGRVGFFLRVPDFDQQYARMRAAGVEFLTAPRTEAYGRVAVFADIAGNRWDLIGPAQPASAAHERNGPRTERPMRERLRDTFDTVARRYHAARPDYPPELFDGLVELTGLRPGARLLEVGCGTGKATIPLAERGFRITAVERGGALAERARENLRGLPEAEAEVDQASFEDWEPAEPFDLVYAATAWHWIDPEVAYAKAAQALRAGGHLAVWGASHAFPVDVDPFFAEIQPVYERIDEHYPDERWPPPPPDQLPGLGEAFQASGLFEVAGLRRYVWAIRYTAEEYLALLDTFSGHIAMAPEKRDLLYAEIRRLLGQRPDNALTRHWVAVLTVGRRR